MDVPLVIWYLSFYCNERTHLAVISKVLFLAIENSSGPWARFMERYIHDENKSHPEINEEEKVGRFEYHPSKLWLICLHQIGYVLISPMVGKL